MLIKDNGNLPDGIESAYSLRDLMHRKLYVLKVVLAKLARVTEKTFRKCSKML